MLLTVSLIVWAEAPWRVCCLRISPSLTSRLLKSLDLVKGVREQWPHIVQLNQLNSFTFHQESKSRWEIAPLFQIQQFCKLNVSFRSNQLKGEFWMLWSRSRNWEGPKVKSQNSQNESKPEGCSALLAKVLTQWSPSLISWVLCKASKWIF